MTTQAVQYQADRVAKFCALTQLALRSGHATPQMLLLHLEPLLESAHLLLAELEEHPISDPIVAEGLGPRVSSLLMGDVQIPDDTRGL